MNGKNLNEKGLSMSKAQSISNMCNQEALEVKRSLNSCNLYQKQVTVEGNDITMVESRPLPENVVDLLIRKGLLHATQAFLMDAIKAKDNLISKLTTERFVYDSEPLPSAPEYKTFVEIPSVDESWGWSQLTTNEYNDYLENEALASHIGQFIHNGGKLDSLRKELANLVTLEWFEIESGKKTPVVIQKNTDSDKLLSLHKELSSLHRKYEQKVNFYKAKVKNLVSAQNVKISKENSIERSKISGENEVLRDKYNKEVEMYNNRMQLAIMEFEKIKETRINMASKLKINYEGTQFAPVINEFLGDID